MTPSVSGGHGWGRAAMCQLWPGYTDAANAAVASYESGKHSKFVLPPLLGSKLAPSCDTVNTVPILCVWIATVYNKGMYQK